MEQPRLANHDEERGDVSSPSVIVATKGTAAYVAARGYSPSCLELAFSEVGIAPVRRPMPLKDRGFLVPAQAARNTHVGTGLPVVLAV